MSICINIFYSGEGDNARRFADEMVNRGTVDLIRAETGNIRYEYYVPFGDNSTVLLIDEWENQEAIDMHHASPMMAIISELREKYNLCMKVKRYISDEKGIPVLDKQYIIA